MRVDEIMTTRVVTTKPDARVNDAAKVLIEYGIASMPVRDDDGRVIGMFSEADVIRDRVPDDPRNYPNRRDRKWAAQERVRQVMTPLAMCLGPHADIRDAAALMLDERLRAIPIVDGRDLLGIVSRRDLLRVLVRPVG